MVACVDRRLSRPHQISGRNGSACRAATRWMQTDPWMLQLQSGKGAPDLACTLGGIQITHACSRHACSTSSGSPSPTAANAMQLRGMKGGGTATGTACTTRPGGRLRSRNVFLLFQGRTKRKIHQFFEPPLTSCVPTNDHWKAQVRCFFHFHFPACWHAPSFLPRFDCPVSKKSPARCESRPFPFPHTSGHTLGQWGVGDTPVQEGVSRRSTHLSLFQASCDPGWPDLSG